MIHLCRLLICNILLVWLLTGCSTPGTRGRSHAAALRRLSPADQQLVLHGHIHPGMNKAAVYIAWGRPDQKLAGGEGKSTSETWVYRQRVTLYEPINSYYFYGPYHGFGDDAAGRGFLPNYASGGIGFDGALHYQPHVRSLDSVRIAEFEGGNVDRYKGADGSWFRSRPPIAETRRVPTGSLIAKRTDRALPHVARRIAKSARPPDETRISIHRGGHAAVGRLATAGIHRLHHTLNKGEGKTGRVRIASDHGSKAGPERLRTHGPPAGSDLHRLGHVHPGAPGKTKPGTA